MDNFIVVAQQVSSNGNLGEIIPVELISFTGVIDKDKIILNWMTATELNNYGFEIEKQVSSMQSAVGNDEWNSIGFVPGYGQQQNKNGIRSLIENVTTGIYQYRLKQFDFDGTFTYSNEIEVEVDFTPKKFLLYQNFPNPFNSSTSNNISITKR